MMEPSAYLLPSGILFGSGVAGVVARKNVLIILMSVEIMLNAVNVAFIAVGSSLGDVTGSIFAFMVMTVAAAGAAGGRRDPQLPLAGARASAFGGDREQRDRALRRAPAPPGGGGERRARAWDFAPRGRAPRGAPVPGTGGVSPTRGGGGVRPLW